MDPFDPNSRAIRSVEELETFKDDLDRSIETSKSAIASQLDDPINIDEWRQRKKETFAKAFHEEEEAMRKAIERFEKTLGETTISSSLPLEEQEALRTKLTAMIHQSHEEKVHALLEGKAKLLTKYFWREVDFLKKLSLDAGKMDAETLNGIKETFSAHQLEEIIYLYREVMEMLQDETDPLSHTKTIEDTLNKGHLYELREELLLAFTEMKLHIKNTLPLVYQELTKIREEEKIAGEASLSSFLSSTHSSMSKVLDKVFTKKLVSDPATIAEFSLFLASQQKSIGPKGMAAAGGTCGSLMAGFALPTAAYSIYKMGNLLHRNQKISGEIEEAHRIQKYAELLLKEGEALQANGMKRKTLSVGKEEEAFSKKEIDQGSHLLSLGYELKEKTEMATRELETEQSGLKGELFLFAGLTASQLASSAGGIGATLNAFLSSFGATTAGVALHWVGMGGAGLGILIGGINLGLSIHEYHGKQKELETLFIKSNELDTLKTEFPTNPLMTSFAQKESSFQLIEEKRLRLDQKNLSISIANNTFLVIAGAVGIAALVTTGAASFGLTLAVIGILFLVTVIATSHFFLKRHWEKKLTSEKMGIENWDDWIKELTQEIKTLDKADPRFTSIVKQLDIPADKETAFHHSPEVFLQMHYLKG